MSIALDIAAALAAVVWPLVIMIALWVFRRQLPDIGRDLRERTKTVELPGLSQELEPATCHDLQRAWPVAYRKFPRRRTRTTTQTGSSLTEAKW